MRSFFYIPCIKRLSVVQTFFFIARMHFYATYLGDSPKLINFRKSSTNSSKKRSQIKTIFCNFGIREKNEENVKLSKLLCYKTTSTIRKKKISLVPTYYFFKVNEWDNKITKNFKVSLILCGILLAKQLKFQWNFFVKSKKFK